MVRRGSAVEARRVKRKKKKKRERDLSSAIVREMRFCGARERERESEVEEALVIIIERRREMKKVGGRVKATRRCLVHLSRVCVSKPRYEIEDPVHLLRWLLHYGKTSHS